MNRTSAHNEHSWVLLEGDNVYARSAAASLRALGYEVFACPGPAATRSCPAIEGRDCDLMAVAEVIVNALGAQDPSGVVASKARAGSNAALLCIGGDAEDADGDTARASAEQLARGLRVAFGGHDL